MLLRQNTGQKQLKEGLFHHLGEGMAQKPEVSGPVVATVRKQERRGWDSARFIVFLQPRSIPDISAHTQGGFSRLSYTSLEIPSWTHPEEHLLGESKSH